MSRCPHCDQTENPIVSQGGETIGGDCPFCGQKWQRCICAACKRAYRYLVPGPRGQRSDNCGKDCPARPKPFSLRPGDLDGRKVRP